MWAAGSSTRTPHYWIGSNADIGPGTGRSPEAPPTSQAAAALQTSTLEPGAPAQLDG